MITEFVNFRVQDTTTDEQLLSVINTMMNDFMKKQDGYVDAELVKSVEGNAWCFIYHFENMENVKAVGVNMRNSKEFGEFVALVVPGSISVNLNHLQKQWNIRTLE